MESPQTRRSCASSQDTFTQPFSPSLILVFLGCRGPHLQLASSSSSRNATELLEHFFQYKKKSWYVNGCCLCSWDVPNTLCWPCSLNWQVSQFGQILEQTPFFYCNRLFRQFLPAPTWLGVGGTVYGRPVISHPPGGLKCLNSTTICMWRSTHFADKNVPSVLTQTT